MSDHANMLMFCLEKKSNPGAANYTIIVDSALSKGSEIIYAFDIINMYNVLFILYLWLRHTDSLQTSVLDFTFYSMIAFRL